MERLNLYSDVYTITERLGSGSGGVVYKAYHKNLKKDVVLKQIKNRDASMLNLRQEADILKNLQHTYLPQVLDFIVDDDGEVYTVMSFVPGKSFLQLLNEGYHFTQEQLIRYGMQLSSVLHYLHSQHPPIIHGDIKPANIMLTPQGNICLIDFNISFYLDDNLILGYSSGFTSPEQYQYAMDSQSLHGMPNRSVVDEKTDIYSVGATLYNLATGKKRLHYQEPLDRNLLVRNTSEGFARIIEKTMANDPAYRFQSALDMFKAFQGVTGCDAAYQKLVRSQRWTRAILVGLIAIFIITMGIGIEMMQTERVRRYDALVERQRIYREDGLYQSSKEAHREAVSILPSALESFYQQAFTYHHQGFYEECIHFIEREILGNDRLDLLQPRMRDVFYLLADSHFQLGEYEDAVLAYERLFRLGDSHDLEHFRGFAIALVYNEEPGRAREVLRDGVEQGLSDDFVYYVQGEIAKMLSIPSDALEYFKKSIEASDDAHLMARAYVMISRLYELKDERGYAREALLEGLNVLPTEHQLLVLEELIQVNIALARDCEQDDADSPYLTEAVQLMMRKIDLGWGTYDTFNNLVVINKQQGQLYEARINLNAMYHRFGEDYNIFKRFAFLELAEQELLDNDERDYEQFAEYFYLARQLYAEQSAGNISDPEMQLLEDLYIDIVDGGWFE